MERRRRGAKAVAKVLLVRMAIILSPHRRERRLTKAPKHDCAHAPYYQLYYDSRQRRRPIPPTMWRMQEPNTSSLASQTHPHRSAAHIAFRYTTAQATTRKPCLPCTHPPHRQRDDLTQTAYHQQGHSPRLNGMRHIAFAGTETTAVAQTMSLPPSHGGLRDLTSQNMGIAGENRSKSDPS